MKPIRKEKVIFFSFLTNEIKTTNIKKPNPRNCMDTIRVIFLFSPQGGGEGGGVNVGPHSVGGFVSRWWDDKNVRKVAQPRTLSPYGKGVMGHSHHGRHGLGRDGGGGGG